MAHDDNGGGDRECGDGPYQYLFIIRHGDRWDYSQPEWKLKPNSRTGDSPLSPLGHRQAYETGEFLKTWFQDRNIAIDQLIWLSSPFLRCLQTSDGILNRLDIGGTIPIKPEYSIFEWDGHDGKWHEDLPTLQERIHYVPRLDIEHTSLFVPELPEPRDQFFARCDKAASEFDQMYPFQANQVVVMVSHAAGCLALSRAFTRHQMDLSDLTPAAPCGIFGMKRRSTDDIWKMDDHDLPGGMNGYTDHLSDLGNSTQPWSNFGNLQGIKYYTGPPSSRFAPAPTADDGAVAAPEKDEDDDDE